MSSHLLCVFPVPASANSPPGGSPEQLSLGNRQCFPFLTKVHTVMTFFFPPYSQKIKLEMSRLTHANSRHVGIQELQGCGLLDLTASCCSSLQGLRNLTRLQKVENHLPDSAVLGFPFILGARQRQVSPLRLREGQRREYVCIYSATYKDKLPM